jgi:hypothetical protein
MYDVGMLALAPASSTAVLAGRAATAELFGVSKKDTPQLRVILDRRPRNCMEKSLGRVLSERLLDGKLAPDVYHHLVRLLALPHPSQLVDLVLAPGEELRISTEDVAEFYHSLEWPEARWAENAVGTLLRPLELLGSVQSEERRQELLMLAERTGNQALQPVLTSPGMGGGSGLCSASHGGGRCLVPFALDELWVAGSDGGLVDRILH